MIRKLMRFELKKQLSNRFFEIVLCIFILGNILLTCGIQEYIDEKRSYEKRYGQEFPWDYWEYRNGFIEGILSDTKSTQVTYALLAMDSEKFASTMIEKYGEEIFKSNVHPPKEAYEGIGYFGEDRNDATMILAYKNVLTWNEYLQTTLSNVVETAKVNGRVALKEEDNYGVRRNIDIIELYTVPRGEITSPIKGWDDFLFDSPTMLFVYLLVLLACGSSFSAEREQKTIYLLHTSKNGKGKTLVAKYISGAAVAVGLTLLFQAVTLASVWFKEGLLGLKQPAASMEQLNMLSWPMTVWQYVLVQLICQIVAAVMLSVLVSTISAVSKTSIVSYILGVLMLGVLIAAQSAKTEWLMGPLSLADTVRYFDSFCTANLFGFPVLWVLLQSVLWLVLCALGIYAGHWVFHRKGKVF